MTRAVFSEEMWGNYSQAIPAKRLGTVEETGDAAAFLAGKLAGYVNGHTFFADAGYVSGGVSEPAEDSG